MTGRPRQAATPGRAIVTAVAAAALVGCGAGPHTRAGGAVTALAVRTVPWNPLAAPVGKVSAVADAGSVVAVFGDAGAIVLSSGAVVATERATTLWLDARAIRGADGSPRWIVGIDGQGRLHYLRGLSSFEDVTSRYGLEGRRVLDVATLDGGRVGFLLDQEIAVADGQRVTRYGAPPLTTLAGGGGRGAGTGPNAVTVFDARMAARSFPLAGVTHVAVGAGGRLYATTPRALYASTGSGDLALIYDAGAATLHGLVASGEAVWFADGAELGVVDGDRVAETRGAEIARDATLAPSPSGDVWVLASGALQRFARAVPESTPGLPWATTLAPIFARSCVSCHLPGGVSGTDLSTAAAWQSAEPAIHDRVVRDRTMPPQGHALSEGDRAAIGAWTEQRATGR
jgi:mono/diheme cytochrome c family protein